MHVAMANRSVPLLSLRCNEVSYFGSSATGDNHLDVENDPSPVPLSFKFGVYFNSVHFFNFGFLVSGSGIGPEQGRRAGTTQRRGVRKGETSRLLTGNLYCFE